MPFIYLFGFNFTIVVACYPDIISIMHLYSHTKIHTHKFWYTCTCTWICICIWTCTSACSFNLNSHGFFNSIKISRFRVSVQICNLLSIVNWKTFRSQLFNNNTELHYCRDINWLLSLHICFFFFSLFSLLFRLLFHLFFPRSLAVSFVDVI